MNWEYECGEWLIEMFGCCFSMWEYRWSVRSSIPTRHYKCVRRSLSLGRVGVGIAFPLNVVECQMHQCNIWYTGSELHFRCSKKSSVLVQLRAKHAGATVLHMQILKRGMSFNIDLWLKNLRTKSFNFLVENRYSRLNWSNQLCWARPGPVFRKKSGESR